MKLSEPLEIGDLVSNWRSGTGTVTKIINHFQVEVDFEVEKYELKKTRLRKIKRHAAMPNSKS